MQQGHAYLQQIPAPINLQLSTHYGYLQEAQKRTDKEKDEKRNESSKREA